MLEQYLVSKFQCWSNIVLLLGYTHDKIILLYCNNLKIWKRFKKKKTEVFYDENKLISQYVYSMRKSLSTTQIF